MLVYTHEDGKTEIFDPKANTLDDENYSDELVSFYLDFYDIYCSNIEEKHRIKSQDWPVTQNNKAVGV